MVRPSSHFGEEARNVPALALVLALGKVSRIVACAWAGKLQNEKGNISTIYIIEMRLARVLVSYLLKAIFLKAHDAVSCTR